MQRFAFNAKVCLWCVLMVARDVGIRFEDVLELFHESQAYYCVCTGYQNIRIIVTFAKLGIDFEWMKGGERLFATSAMEAEGNKKLKRTAQSFITIAHTHYIFAENLGPPIKKEGLKRYRWEQLH